MLFLEEWENFLANYAIVNKEILIVGDLNFHLEDKENHDTKRFSSLLESCGLHQLVQQPTHVHGHTLDTIIIRDTSNIISNITVTDPGLSGHDGKLTRDHFAVNFTTTLAKPTPDQKKVSFHKLRAINTEAFMEDVKNSTMLHVVDGSVDDLVTAYNDGLRSLIDIHASLCTKTDNIATQVSMVH